MEFLRKQQNLYEIRYITNHICNIISDCDHDHILQRAAQ